jgi:hypothetical protein
MSNANLSRTVMAYRAMVTGFTGRDVATSRIWLDPQAQQPALKALKHQCSKRGAGLRPIDRMRRETPMRLPTESRLPSPVCRPAFSRGG